MKAKAHLDAIVRLETAHPDRMGKLRLDRNERPHPWPPEVWEEIRACITPELLQAYPDLAPVYEALSRHFSLSAEHMLLTHASDNALKTIFEVYAAPGDEAVILEPTYAMYPLYARMFGAVPRPVCFDSDLSLDFEKLLAAIGPRTRLVCLPNPNQPVERIFSRGEILHLLALAQQHDFLLVVDEAYAYFQAETAVDLVGSTDRLIVTRSFSKAFGLAGVRGGLLLSSPVRIAELRKIKPISEMNSVAAALVRFFLGRMEIIEDFARDVEQGRSMVQQCAQRLNMPTHGVTGNSILLKAADSAAAGRLAQAAKAQGILIKTFTDPLLASWLRITLAPAAQMRMLLDVLERSCK